MRNEAGTTLIRLAALVLLVTSVGPGTGVMAAVGRQQTTPDPVPSAHGTQSRGYTRTGREWIACGMLPEQGSREGILNQYGSRYEASGGEQLFFVRDKSLSPTGAQLQLRTYLGEQAGGDRPWKVATRREMRHGTLVQLAEAYAVALDEETDTTARCVFAWIDGSELRLIYGPDEAHVLALYDANPAGQW